MGTRAEAGSGCPEVVGLGYCSWDYLGIVEHIPSFDSPTVSLDSFAMSGGGPVATALVALAKLGTHTGYIGTIGNDQAGLQVKGAFEEEGVDLLRMRLQKGARSDICVVLVQAGTGARSILCYRGTRSDVQLQRADRRYVTTARFLHLDGHHMQAAITAAQWMREAGGTVVLDANKARPRMEQLLPWVDVLITNAGFPAAYTGKTDLAESARLLLKGGVQLVVTTLGENGCACFLEGTSVHVPGFAVPVADTTGAGDAFHGAFIYGLLRSWTVQRTAMFANAVAAINCTALGGRAALPTLPQAVSFLRSSGRWDRPET